MPNFNVYVAGTHVHAGDDLGHARTLAGVNIKQYKADGAAIKDRDGKLLETCRWGIDADGNAVLVSEPAKAGK